MMETMMETMMEIKCDICGKIFYPGNNHEGLPNGMGFAKKDGTVINYCRECIIEEGRRMKNKGSSGKEKKK